MNDFSRTFPSADAFVDALFELMESSGGVTYFDSGVTQLEHALQCACLAQEAGAPDSLVAAALLHDVGHIMVDEHNGWQAFSDPTFITRRSGRGCSAGGSVPRWCIRSLSTCAPSVISSESSPSMRQCCRRDAAKPSCARRAVVDPRGQRVYHRCALAGCHQIAAVGRPSQGARPSGAASTRVRAAAFKVGTHSKSAAAAVDHAGIR